MSLEQGMGITFIRTIECCPPPWSCFSRSSYRRSIPRSSSSFFSSSSTSSSSYYWTPSIHPSLNFRTLLLNIEPYERLLLLLLLAHSDPSTGLLAPAPILPPSLLDVSRTYTWAYCKLFSLYIFPRVWLLGTAPISAYTYRQYDGESFFLSLLYPSSVRWSFSCLNEV